MHTVAASRRFPWLVLLAAWVVCTALVLFHLAAVRDYVALLNAQGLRDANEAPTPLRQVIPARHADAQMWVRHTLAAETAGEWRVRTTTADNAPDGREVHWASALPWLLRGAAAIQHRVSGQSEPLALERAILWFNAPLLLALMVLISTWTATRAGAGAGAVIAIGMVGHSRFYSAFAPTDVDHHGLVATAVLGLLLGVLFMGAGWWKPATGTAPTVLPTTPAQARRGAIISALCGAIGLWLSAAAVLPVIALICAAGVVIAWRLDHAKPADGTTFEPTLWRLWGRVGAGASVGFYLLEYAPSHFGLRLEVNHPLHALAWWGGAEMVARVAARRLDGSGTGSAFRLKLVLPVLAVAAAPTVMIFGGSTAFLVGDPFVGELRHFVAEGKSVAAVAGESGLRPLLFDLASGLVLVPAYFVFRRQRGAHATVTGLLLLVTFALVTLAFFELRWWLTASAAQLALLLPLLAVATARWRWTPLVAGGLLLMPAIHRIVNDRAENARQTVAASDLMQPLYRDIAATLRTSQPAGDIVLLASPNASAGISYFGGFRSLGTLYWENTAGLRAAARIFSAATDDDAFALLRARQVTHVAMISTANFLGEYFQLLHPSSASTASRETFGHRLLEKRSVPAWLQPIPYRCPAELKTDGLVVRLFKIAPNQTEAERLHQTVLAALAEGDAASAERQANALLNRSAPESLAAVNEAVGAAFYDYGIDAAAVRWLRRALALTPDPGVTNTLAWILTTTRDDTLRDGRAALALIEPVASRASDDPTVLSTLAAANAEAGRFAEAVGAAERALALVRAAGDGTSAELLEKRLNAYRAGRPWRQ